MKFRINLKHSMLRSPILAFALVSYAPGQDIPLSPSPTPDETPAVISRDETDAESDPPLVTDVRESIDRPSGPVVSKQTGLALPPVPSSTYNISLSEAQQKMMLYLDFLAKTEARAENLRSKLFEMIEKENSVKGQIQQIDYNLRPDQLQNAAALIGSLRPEDIRDERSRMLKTERKNLQDLLTQIEVSRSKLEAALTSADRLVERVRVRFEAFVEKALGDEAEPQ